MTGKRHSLSIMSSSGCRDLFAKVVPPHAWRVVATIAMLAFVLQAIVLQTHVHWSTSPTVAAGPSQVRVVDRSGPGDPSKSCAICEAQHIAGNVLTPDSCASQLSQAATFCAQASVDLPTVVVERTHTRKSRAPPEPDLA